MFGRSRIRSTAFAAIAPRKCLLDFRIAAVRILVEQSFALYGVREGSNTVVRPRRSRLGVWRPSRLPCGFFNSTLIHRSCGDPCRVFREYVGATFTDRSVLLSASKWEKNPSYCDIARSFGLWVSARRGQAIRIDFGRCRGIRSTRRIRRPTVRRRQFEF